MAHITAEAYAGSTGTQRGCGCLLRVEPERGAEVHWVDMENLLSQGRHSGTDGTAHTNTWCQEQSIEHHEASPPKCGHIARSVGEGWTPSCCHAQELALPQSRHPEKPPTCSLLSSAVASANSQIWKSLLRPRQGGKSVATAKSHRPAPWLRKPRHRWAARERQEGWTTICPL